VELDREGWEGDHVTKYLPVHHPLEEPQAELLRFKVSYHAKLSYISLPSAGFHSGQGVGKGGGEKLKSSSKVTSPIQMFVNCLLGFRDLDCNPMTPPSV
jgi:hypothetical protein